MKRIASIAVLALALLGPAVSAQDKKPEDPKLALKETLDDLLKAPVAKKSKVGIYIQDLKTGEVLYERNAQESMIPASNTKLVSSAAALHHLGPEYRFRTLFAAEKGSQTGGVIKGDLFIKGFGDPSLEMKDLWGLADRVATAGVSEVSGDLVIDGSFFDDQIDPPGFETKPNVQSPYRAPVSAAAVNYNVVGVLVYPGEKAGDPARVVLDPDVGYVVVEGGAKTGKRNSISLDCEDAGDKMRCTLDGQVATGGEGEKIYRRAMNPSYFFAHAARAALKSRGIPVKGKLKLGPTPKDAEALFTHTSDELGAIIRPLNKNSNNFVAEMVLKTLGAEYKGAPGSTQGGIEAVAAYLETIGIPKGSYKMSNGSGLWGDTRFSPAQLVKVLDAVYRDFKIAPDYVASLAIAGTDGTLRSRMKKGPAQGYLKAKTGTLDGASSLSGYLKRKGDDVIAFSILFNDIEGGSAKTVQSQIGVALADYLLDLGHEDAPRQDPDSVTDEEF